MRSALLDVCRRPLRFAAVLLAVMISVGFMAACLIFTATETHAIAKALTVRTSSSDVVARLDQDPGELMRRKIAAAPGVDSVEPTFEGYSEFSTPAGSGQWNVDSLPTNPRLRWATLVSGSWPHARNEIAISRPMAKQYHLSLGSQVAFGGNAARTVRVSGITNQSRSLFSGLSDSVFVDVSYFTGRGVQSAPTYLVLAENGTLPEQVADAVRAVLPAGTYVETSQTVSAEALADASNGANVFGYLLLTFAAIALFVGSLIIANTFTILLAQRRRQVGLLRAVGASRTQVRRQILAEALLLGVIGSGFGVVLGLGLAAVGSAVTGSLAAGLVVPVGRVLAAGLLGILVTVVSALVPAARAIRVTPLEALRPVTDEATSKRSRRWTLVLAAGFIGIGATVIFVAMTATSNNLLLAIVGSLLLATGILTATPAFLPVLLRSVGALSGRTGPIGRLAVANLVRNPRRAATTATALMLGVGLIVTLQVGAASIKATVNDSLNSEFPVDLTVTNPLGPLSRDVIQAVSGVPGLKATTPVRMTTVGVRAGRAAVQQIRVAGLGSDAGSVVAAGLGALKDDTLLAHHFTLESLGISSGDRVTLTYDARSATYTVLASDVADAGTLVMTEAALNRLAPNAPVAAVWAAATDRSQASSIMAAVQRATNTQPGLAVAGSLEQSASLNKILDALLAVATGLLAVAVLISLIGVGNTLGLSVIERTRESALLRALGLQRRELRLMLAIEAVLLALVGAVVGIAAGALFGLIGTAAVVKEAHLSQLRFSMSVPQTLAVVAIVILAGALASVLPARRAAQAAPTDALAEI